MRKGKSSDSRYTEGSLSVRFDKWYRETMKYLLLDEIRDYLRRGDRFLPFDPENLESIEDRESYSPFLEFEMEQVSLGDSLLFVHESSLANGLRRLSPQKKRVLEGTVLLKLPVKIVAKNMDLSEQTVKNYKHSGLMSLREIMRGDHSGKKKRE